MREVHKVTVKVTNIEVSKNWALNRPTDETTIHYIATIHYDEQGNRSETAGKVLLGEDIVITRDELNGDA